MSAVYMYVNYDSEFFKMMTNCCQLVVGGGGLKAWWVWRNCMMRQLH